MRRAGTIVTVLAGLLLGGCRSGTAHYPAENPLGPYSGAVASGGLLFVSGKIGDPGADFGAQADAALAAVDDQLRRAGAGWGDVLSVTVYLADMERYREFNEIYQRRVPAPRPARAVVAVSALPAGAAVEIQVVARAR